MRYNELNYIGHKKDIPKNVEEVLQMEELILASASPRRKELLQQVRIPFVIQPSEVDETIVVLEGSPAEKAERLAHTKAVDVAARNGKGLVLGADTIVELDHIIYGKPADSEDAFRMLSKLSGRQHSVITGIAVIDCSTGICRIAHEITRVTFAKLAEKEINAYIATGEPFGKAGAYAIQGFGALLVEGISGCYANVVGLPIMRLRKVLEEFGISVL
jgi:septum formation protein